MMLFGKRIILVLVVVFVGFGAVCWGETADEQGKERILHFPKERSLGMIKIMDANIKRQIQTSRYDSLDSVGWDDWEDWKKAEYLGEAQGDVIIPKGKKAALFLNKEAIKDLSPLLNLKPDDLYMLSHIPIAWNKNPRLSAKCMKYISHLAGLKNLYLFGTKTTTEGMKHITELQSLEMLQPPKGLTNKGLSYVAELKSLKRLYFTENRVTNAGLKRHLPKLTKLEELVLNGERINDGGLVFLKDLPKLHYLSIRYGNFTDAGMAHVKKCRRLRNLDLNSLPITDEGVYHLSGLDKLEDLNLFNTEVTDRGLIYLKMMHSLKKLDIGKRNQRGQITDVGMVHLAQINSLEYLVLPHRDITDKGIAQIAKLKNLKYLWVGCGTNSLLTDKALQHLSKLQSLEYVHIGGRGFTDAGMDDLAKLTNLRKLNISFDNSITNKGLAKLKTLKLLERLSLTCNNATISGLSHLNALKNISDLDIDGIKQDNSGLDISGLTKLEEFRLTTNFRPSRNKLAFDPVRDEDLACLAKLKNLRKLVIGGGVRSATVTDAGIAYLKDLPNMRELYCRSPYLTDKSISYVANMKTLRSLSLIGSFTDEGLGYLEELKELLRLKIYSANKFSPAALRRLRKALPNIQTFEVQNEEADRRRRGRPR